MKTQLIGWVAMVTLFLTACGMGNSPKKSADKFLNSFNERNFAEARKYATPETIKLVDLMENLTKMAESTDSTEKKSVTVIDEKIDGETAVVTFKESGDEEVQEVRLKKIDGKWLVHVTKEDIAAKDNGIGSGMDEEGEMMLPDSTDMMMIDSLSAQLPDSAQ